VNYALGKASTFECRQCKYSAHRDVNGAKNILTNTITNLKCGKEG
jgi:transposase